MVTTIPLIVRNKATLLVATLTLVITAFAVTRAERQLIATSLQFLHIGVASKAHAETVDMVALVRNVVGA